jgi:hypothetical protein
MGRRYEVESISEMEITGVVFDELANHASLGMPHSKAYAKLAWE